MERDSKGPYEEETRSQKRDPGAPFTWPGMNRSGDGGTVSGGGRS